jgi:hypothetical protein
LGIAFENLHELGVLRGANPALKKNANKKSASLLWRGKRF